MVEAESHPLQKQREILREFRQAVVNRRQQEKRAQQRWEAKQQDAEATLKRILEDAERRLSREGVQAERRHEDALREAETRRSQTIRKAENLLKQTKDETGTRYRSDEKQADTILEQTRQEAQRKREQEESEITERYWAEARTAEQTWAEAQVLAGEKQSQVQKYLSRAQSNLREAQLSLERLIPVEIPAASPGQINSDSDPAQALQNSVDTVDQARIAIRSAVYDLLGWRVRQRRIRVWVIGIAVVACVTLLISWSVRNTHIQEMARQATATALHPTYVAMTTATAQAQATTATQAYLNRPQISIENASNMQLLDTVSAHSNWISAIDFSHDGALLASSAWDDTVKIWQVQFDRLKQHRKISHSGQVQDVIFSPDGESIVSSECTTKFSPEKPCETGVIQIYNPAKGLITEMKLPTSGTVNTIAIAPDGKTLASGSDDFIVRLWPAVGETSVHWLEGHTNTVLSVAFSPDGVMLASGAWDGTVRLWRVSDGALLYTMEGPTVAVNSVAFSPDGAMLAAVGGDTSPILVVWGVTTGQRLYERTDHALSASSVTFSPDGSLLATGGGHLDKTIVVRRASDGQPLVFLSGHESWVADLAFSPDGRLLVSGGGDGTVRLWGVQ